MTEIPLTGGVANIGAVVRVGDTVRRPAAPFTATVHGFLRHLRANGMADTVPEPLGFDDQGREMLGYLPGEAFDEPYPDLIAGERVLLRVAELQARLHMAAVGFVPASDAVWTDDSTFPIGAHGSLVCHNDLCVQNVIFDRDRPSGIIDFDYAKPVDRLFDIMVAARHWVPLRPLNAIGDARRGTDTTRRFRIFCDVHDLDASDRGSVIGLLSAALPMWLDSFHVHAAAEHVGFAAALADGYAEMNRDSRAWVDANRGRLTG